MSTPTLTAPFLPTFRQEHYVHSYQADAGHRIYTTTLLHFMQESAWRHAEELGLGYKALELAGQYWVLSRMYVEFFQLPLWGDTVTVETWPRGVEGLFAMREFRMFNSADSLLAAGSSAWLILDAQTHRPSRSGLACFDGLTLRKEKATDYQPLKIALPDTMENMGCVEVHLSDIDVLKHVNNVRYFNWALDRTPELLQNPSIASVELNFLSESHAGDILGIAGQSCDSFRFFSMTKSGGAEACRCKIGLPET